MASMSGDAAVHQRLYEVMDDSAMSLGEKQRRALAIGRAFLEVEHGHIQRRDEDDHTDTVVASDGDNDELLNEGTVLDRTTTYCRRVIDTAGPIALTDAANEGWADDPAYQKHGLACYLGTRIFVDGELYGTVCFTSREARETDFKSEELAVIELIARLLGREIEAARHEQRLDDTRQAQKQLADKYESLLQQAPDAVFLADATTADITEVNERAAELTGYSVAELEGMSVLDLHPPTNREKYAQLFGSEFSGGPQASFEDGRPLYIRRADGSDLPIEMSVSSIDIDDQQLIQGVVRDISTRRHREQELERSKEFLEQTQEAADLGGWEYDIRAETLRWSDEVHRIYDLPLDYEPTVSEALEFFHPEDRSIIIHAFERLTTTGESYDLELRIVTAKDEIRWVRAIGRPQYGDDEEEEIIAVRGVFQDITDRKERELDLHMKSRALEESTVGITIADANQPDQPIIYANDGFTKMTGYPKEKVIGENCRFLQGERTDEATVSEIRQAIDSTTPIRTEILNYRADGTPFWNKLTIAPVTGKDGGEVTHFVGIQEDVTVEKRHERLLEVLDRVLRHNLRNDMTAVGGFAELIAERTEGEIARQARLIKDRATDLTALSEKAQDIQAAVRNPEPLAPRDIQADVRAVVGNLQTEFPNIDFNIDSSPCEKVMATERLRLALQELGSNAAQHGNSSEVTYQLEMAEEDTVSVSVKDCGPGLPDIEREILEAGRETPLQHGSGLGLWLVNWIVTGFGGEVTTTVDNGTTVSIQFSPAPEGAVPEHREAALSGTRE